VLVTLPSQLISHMPEFSQHDTACVITRDHVPEIPSPGVVVADRWGEIVHIAAGADVDGLPLPRELLEWTGYVQHQCPECEGEAK
jgi:hypothetical protein